MTTSAYDKLHDYLRKIYDIKEDLDDLAEGLDRMLVSLEYRGEKSSVLIELARCTQALCHSADNADSAYSWIHSTISTAGMTGIEED